MRNAEMNVESERPSLLRRLFAFVILIAAAALALKVIIGFVMAIFWIVVAVVVLGAVLWAVKTIVW